MSLDWKLRLGRGIYIYIGIYVICIIPVYNHLPSFLILSKKSSKQLLTGLFWEMSLLIPSTREVGSHDLAVHTNSFRMSLLCPVTLCQNTCNTQLYVQVPFWRNTNGMYSLGAEDEQWLESTGIQKVEPSTLLEPYEKVHSFHLFLSHMV